MAQHHIKQLVLSWLRMVHRKVTPWTALKRTFL